MTFLDGIIRERVEAVPQDGVSPWEELSCVCLA